MSSILTLAFELPSRIVQLRPATELQPEMRLKLEYPAKYRPVHARLALEHQPAITIGRDRIGGDVGDQVDQGITDGGGVKVSRVQAAFSSIKEIGATSIWKVRSCSSIHRSNCICNASQNRVPFPKALPNLIAMS